jgi:heterodisulfide reductase subunit C
MAHRIEALTYLGWRAVLAHPFRLVRNEGTAKERFLANYAPDGCVPMSEEDRRFGEAASGCIGCGLCELGCDLAGAVPTARAMGLEAAFRLYSRSAVALSHAREALGACGGCRGCEPLCPTGVPIGDIVRHLLSRLEGAVR